MKLAKVYEPQQYEANIYQLWETAAAFAPRKDGEGTYSIVLPPPNANGNLHMGHALIVAVEDVLIRYNRMLGKSTLYLPGADHAGFETWVVYERQLEKEGKSRFDFSREELYRGVWDFVHQHRGNMEVQLKELGGSLDWDHSTFTLDEKVVKTSYQTFKTLWDDGLVYRGKRLVNYCTKHHTAFADIEVEYEDRTTPLYYLKYGPFELATTRPETKFGDTGVAVHPDDMRYKEYVGQEIEVEGVNGPFKVRVVADDHVDPTFGTGVVKVTPAHDFNDWEMGQTHNLPAVSVIDLDGKMTERAGKYARHDRSRSPQSSRPSYAREGDATADRRELQEPRRCLLQVRHGHRANASRPVVPQGCRSGRARQRRRSERRHHILACLSR
jgi:valyl-tRNA synthetase